MRRFDRFNMTARVLILVLAVTLIGCAWVEAQTRFTAANEIRVGTGGIKVGTAANSWNKFQVAGATGNTSVAGTLTSTGAFTCPSIASTDSSLGISGLNGASGAAGGAIVLLSGTGHTNGAGGVLTATAGAGAGTGAGGALTLTGGASGTGATGNGGAISLLGGAAASTNGLGGAAALTGGAGRGTGAGGATAITGGASGTGATGNGGAASLIGGAALSTNGNGGASALTGGVGRGTGTGGAVTITSGASAGASGTAGAITIDTGAATGGTAGVVTIGGTNAARVVTGPLQNKLRVVAKAADYTVLATDTGVVFTTTGAEAAVTFTLPAVATVGFVATFINTVDQNMTVRAVAADVNKVITFNNATTADGVTYSTSSQKIGARCSVISDGAKWIIINESPNTATVETSLT